MGVPVGVDTISRLRYAMGSGFFFDSQFQGLADVIDYNGGGLLNGVTTAAGARTALGLGTVSTQNANAIALTGGTITGLAGLDTGTSNTRLGPTALGSVTSGTANVAVGSNALFALTSATGYVAIGDHALEAVVSLNTLGASVGIGRSAGSLDVGGTGNIYIGDQAGQNNVSGNECVYIGRQAGINATGNSNTVVGLNSLTAVTSGANNTIFGQDAAKFIGTTSGSNTLIGQSSGKTVTGASAMNNMTALGAGTFLYAVGSGDMNSVAIGYLAMQGNSNGTSSTGGTQCVAIGTNTLLNYTTATQVVAIGHGAGIGITTGGQSVFIGTNAGSNITTGGDLIMIGTYRSNNGVTGVTTGTSDAIAIGVNIKIGTNDLAIGANALSSSTENSNGNVALGHDALHFTTSGDNNIGLGPGAGYSLTTGSNNLFLGPAGGTTITTGSGNILIGVSNAVDTAASGSSNTFRFGGTGGVTFSATGLDGVTPAWSFLGSLTVGSTVQAATKFINGVSGPTWSQGTGAPGATEPVGSLYSRTDGGAGTRLYVSAGAGSWTAVALV